MESLISSVLFRKYQSNTFNIKSCAIVLFPANCYLEGSLSFKSYSLYSVSSDYIISVSTVGRSC